MAEELKEQANAKAKSFLNQASNVGGKIAGDALHHAGNIGEKMAKTGLDISEKAADVAITKNASLTVASKFVEMGTGFNPQTEALKKVHEAKEKVESKIHEGRLKAENSIKEVAETKANELKEAALNKIDSTVDKQQAESLTNFIRPVGQPIESQPEKKVSFEQSPPIYQQPMYQQPPIYQQQYMYPPPPQQSTFQQIQQFQNQASQALQNSAIGKRLNNLPINELLYGKPGGETAEERKAREKKKMILRGVSIAFSIIFVVGAICAAVAIYLYFKKLTLAGFLGDMMGSVAGLFPGGSEATSFGKRLIAGKATQSDSKVGKFVDHTGNLMLTGKSKSKEKRQAQQKKNEAERAEAAKPWYSVFTQTATTA